MVWNVTGTIAMSEMTCVVGDFLVYWAGSGIFGGKYFWACKLGLGRLCFGLGFGV